MWCMAQTWPQQIPTICAAVGANCEVIQHGENGMLASTNEEWLASLSKGKTTPARTPGSKAYPVIEPAPGSYVRVK